jgi:hypothetical protein
MPLETTANVKAALMYIHITADCFVSGSGLAALGSDCRESGTEQKRALLAISEDNNEADQTSRAVTFGET